MPTHTSPPGAGPRVQRVGRRPMLVAGLSAAGLGAAAAALIAGVPVLADGGSHQGASRHTHLPSGFLQATGTADDWPPRIVGATGIRQVMSRPDPLPRATVNLVMPGRAPRTAAQRALKRILGARFVRIYVDRATDAKGRPRPGQVRTQFVSYTRNQVVQVDERAGRIVRIVRSPLWKTQPGRVESEQRVAVSMARRLLVNRGETRVNDLKGWAIMGMPGEDNPFSDVTTPHFPHRVLYVSFHADRLAVPEYSAWVDLSDRIVMRAGPTEGTR